MGVGKSALNLELARYRRHHLDFTAVDLRLRRIGKARLVHPVDDLECGDLKVLVIIIKGCRIEAEAAVRGLETHRSEEHTSELQSLMRISYAVFCLKKKTQNKP